MSTWRFAASRDAWGAEVRAVPSEETKRRFWELAVPALAAQSDPPPPHPCVVVCRVSAPAASGRSPGGPLGRAKGLLDALHDDRKSGPWYRALGVRAPLIDDHPEHVCGLAVEVRSGGPLTEYQLGTNLQIHGDLLASVPVEAAAPNDIAGTSSEQAKIALARVAFAAAVQRAFHPQQSVRSPSALVVRHWPQRDEDNTWATWIAAVCGVRGMRGDHWARHAPLAGWAPAAIASVADATLSSPVQYEIWG